MLLLVLLMLITLSMKPSKKVRTCMLTYAYLLTNFLIIFRIGESFSNIYYLFYLENDYCIIEYLLFINNFNAEKC